MLLNVMHTLQVLDTLAEIQERHEAVKELEKSLMELHQIFLDMAVLVEAQGAMLDNIENQVSPTLSGQALQERSWRHSASLIIDPQSMCQRELVALMPVVSRDA